MRTSHFCTEIGSCIHITSFIRTKQVSLQDKRCLLTLWFTGRLLPLLTLTPTMNSLNYSPLTSKTSKLITMLSHLDNFCWKKNASQRRFSILQSSTVETRFMIATSQSDKSFLMRKRSSGKSMTPKLTTLNSVMFMTKTTTSHSLTSQDSLS